MPEDYDYWAEGNGGWNWTPVLPAFKRLERDLDFGGGLPRRQWAYHHSSLSCDELEPQHQAFLETADALGYLIARMPTTPTDTVQVRSP